MDSILNYRETVADRQALPPDIFLECVFRPFAGPAVVTTDAVARPEDQIFVSDPQTGLRFATQDVRVRVTVFAPDGDEVVSRMVAVPVVGQPGLPVEFVVPSELEDQEWRVTVRNIRDKEMTCSTAVEFVGGRVLLHATPISLRVLNHALREMLLGLSLGVRFEGSQGIVTLSPDLAVVLGKAPAPITFDLGVDVARDISMKTFTARAETKRRESGVVRPSIRLLVEFETVGDTEVQFDVPPFGDVELADLEEATIQVDVGLSTKPGRHGTGSIVPFFLVEARIGLDKTVIGGIVSGIKDAWPSGDSFDETIAAAVVELEIVLRRQVVPIATRYLTEAFLQLASRTDVLRDLTAEDDAFVVRHFDPEFRPTPDAQIDDTRLAIDVAGPVDPSTGHLPGPDAALDRLANIETFVVLMQENRSFDHMLGYLSLHGGRPDIDGLQGNERNQAPGGLVNGINPLQDTKFALSPAHEIESVLEQIADGDMTGFLASFRERYPLASLGEDDPSRESPLSFYEAEQLPALDFLARNFLVCNRWFCSFPGATQPNRFCTLSGTTPTLNNLSLADPRVGYVSEQTIFDLLPQEVDWVYYESDVATLRFYDRYRLDDTHVIPFDDDREGFARRAAEGRLPPVVFIDPDFVDVPFGRLANDDHPPADVASGEALIANIYNRLVRSPQWPSLLFVITYDEHGGFFDHVAPPGTRRANTEAAAAGLPATSVRPAHPDAPTFLGVRVPTLVVSPWVAAGQASSAVFDHMSIGRSILLRFLGRDAPMPSRRMRGSRHLGEILGDERRTDRPVMPSLEPPPRPLHDAEVPPGGEVPLLTGALDDKDDFHEIIRRFGQPIRRLGGVAGLAPSHVEDMFDVIEPLTDGTTGTSDDVD